jgi:chromosomal replication initiation ATPase DnaA
VAALARSVVVLSGPEGSGKTHLAQIWAERSGAEVWQCEELHRKQGFPSPPEGGLVVEDVDPERVPQRTLFHLVNGAKEAGANLLLTSRRPAEGWRVELADLRSRLRMAAPAALDQPDDDLLRRALVKLFADRQLIVRKPVVDYLLARMERSLAAAVSVVATVDREALASRRPITRRLVAEVLSLLPDDGGEFTDIP